MKLGFTGTQQGATHKQVNSLIVLLNQLKPTEVHHGCCVGADYQFHNLCLTRSYKIVLHPPINTTKMAPVGEFFESREPAPYLKRNQHIVEECDILIACPKEMEEEVRSGTWATIRRVRRADKEHYIIWPTGSYHHVQPQGGDLF